MEKNTYKGYDITGTECLDIYKTLEEHNVIPYNCEVDEISYPEIKKYVERLLETATIEKLSENDTNPIFREFLNERIDELDRLAKSFIEERGNTYEYRCAVKSTKEKEKEKMKEDLDKQLDKVAGKLLKFIETGKDISDTKAADLLEKLMNQYLVDDLSGLDFYELEKVIDLANKISSVGIIELNIKKNPDEDLASLIDPALEELGKEIDILVKKNTKGLINKVKEDKIELDKEGLDILIDQCKDDTDAINYLRKKFYDKEQKKDAFDDFKNLISAIFKADNTDNTKMGRIDELLDIFDKRMPDRWITDLSEDAYKTLKETLDTGLSAAKMSTEFIHGRSKEEQDKKKEKQIMMDLEDMLTKEEAKDSLFDKKDVVCGNASIKDPFKCKGLCSVCSFNKKKEQTVVKKAMISQPMSGLSSKQIEEARAKAKKAVEDLGYEFVNTYFSDLWERREELKSEGYKNLPIYFLSKAITKMSRCDAVYFCKGWKRSIGCRIEHDIARSYGIPCFFEDPNEE